MRRQLTSREKLLLALLGIIVAISGYFLLYYTPMTDERDRCLAATEDCKIEIQAANIRLEEKHRMERELEELFSRDTPPLSIPDYDNRAPVMSELNSILSGTRDYTLSFGTLDTSQKIIRRSIIMNFTSPNYGSAKEVLRRLNDCGYRCMLDNVGITFGGEGVSVSGNIVFFEYQEEPVAAEE